MCINRLFFWFLNKNVQQTLEIKAVTCGFIEIYFKKGIKATAFSLVT